MPSYDHLAICCNKEFELEYSIKEDPPKDCPFCGAKDSVKRLISGGSGKGIVILGDHEFRQHVKEEASKTVREAGRNEKLLANLVGEDKYQGNVQIQDKVRQTNKERPKIKYRK